MIPFHKKEREKKLYVKCYSTPCLYGQMKTHKDGYPIRPVVASYTSPAFRLAKYLTSWFRDCTNFTPRHSIKNSLQLAQELEDLRFTPDVRLISSDVSSMFTCLPIEKSIDILYEILVKSGVDWSIADEFEHLAHTCLDSNVCQFNGKTFKFPGGVSMRGPVSSLIAEAFMDRLER